eukprot:122967_1
MSAVKSTDDTFPDTLIGLEESIGIIVLIGLQSFYTLILTPLSIYYAYKFYKLSLENISFFIKRYPKIVIFTIIIYNFYPLIILPISCFLWILNFGNSNIQLISLILTNTIQLLSYASLTRLWKLYFDYNHCLQSLSIEWKKQITKTQNQNPWTVKYKYLGSIKILFIAYGILCIIIILYLGFGMMIVGDLNSNYLSYLQWI